MLWQEVQRNLPHKWLVVEAVSSHREGDTTLVDDVTVIEVSDDGWAAMARQSALQREQPDRAFHSVHTDQTEVVIREKPMLGVRGIRWS